MSSSEECGTDLSSSLLVVMSGGMCSILFDYGNKSSHRPPYFNKIPTEIKQFLLFCYITERPEGEKLPRNKMMGFSSDFGFSWRETHGLNFKRLKWICGLWDKPSLGLLSVAITKHLRLGIVVRGCAQNN